MPTPLAKAHVDQLFAEKNLGGIYWAISVVEKSRELQPATARAIGAWHNERPNQEEQKAKSRLVSETRGTGLVRHRGGVRVGMHVAG